MVALQGKKKITEWTAPCRLGHTRPWLGASNLLVEQGLTSKEVIANWFLGRKKKSISIYLVTLWNVIIFCCGCLWLLFKLHILSPGPSAEEIIKWAPPGVVSSPKSLPQNCILSKAMSQPSPSGDSCTKHINPLARVQDRTISYEIPFRNKARCAV